MTKLHWFALLAAWYGTRLAVWIHVKFLA